MNRNGPKQGKSVAKKLHLPIEIEVFVNPDGSVTFADLEAGALSVVRKLNPDEPLSCDANPCARK